MPVYTHDLKTGWVARSDGDAGVYWWAGTTWCVSFGDLTEALVSPTKMSLTTAMPERCTPQRLDDARAEAADRWRHAWFHFCDEAQVAPDTTRTPDDLCARYERETGRVQTVYNVKRLLRSYKAALRFGHKIASPPGE